MSAMKKNNKMDDKTQAFNVRYSNKDIMNKLDNIHKDIGKLKTSVAVVFEKAKTNRILIFAAFTAITTITVILINMINKIPKI